MKEISVQELKKLRDAHADFFLLDVRNPQEYDAANLGGHLIPLTELPERLNELDQDKQIIVHCQMGGRSSHAAMYLEQQGFHNVYNLKGGLTAWINEIDPALKK